MEEWSDKRRRCQDAVRKKDSLTFAKMRVKDSVAHGPQIGESIKPNEERTGTRKLGPPDLSIALSNEGATAQMCGDSNVAEKWMDNGQYAMGKYKD